MIYPDLTKCKLINQSVTQILDNPMFWITKLIQSGLLKEHQKEWIKAIQLETNSEMKKYIAAYLEWNLKKPFWINIKISQTYWLVRYDIL